MTDFDDRLRDSLSVDDEEFLKNLEGERGIFTQFTAILQGRLAMLTWFAGVLTLLFSIMGIYSAWRVFQTTNTHELIIWLMGFIFSLNAVSMLKLWMFNRMGTLSILREVKRLELRITRLSKQS